MAPPRGFEPLVTPFQRSDQRVPAVACFFNSFSLSLSAEPAALPLSSRPRVLGNGGTVPAGGRCHRGTPFIKRLDAGHGRKGRMTACRAVSRDLGRPRGARENTMTRFQIPIFEMLFSDSGFQYARFRITSFKRADFWNGDFKEGDSRMMIQNTCLHGLDLGIAVRDVEGPPVRTSIERSGHVGSCSKGLRIRTVAAGCSEGP